MNGTPDQAEVVINVEARRWPEPAPVVVERYLACAEVTRECALKYPPDTLRHLGQTRIIALNRLNLAQRAAHVQSGPNQGFAYVGGTTSPVRYDSIIVQMNRVVQDRNDPFWRTQDCSFDEMSTWVKQHEYAHARLALELFEKGLANEYSIEAQVHFVPIEQMRRILADMEPDVRKYVTDYADLYHWRTRELWTPMQPSCDIYKTLVPKA